MKAIGVSLVGITTQDFTLRTIFVCSITSRTGRRSFCWLITIRFPSIDVSIEYPEVFSQMQQEYWARYELAKRLAAEKRVYPPKKGDWLPVSSWWRDETVRYASCRCTIKKMFRPFRTKTIVTSNTHDCCPGLYSVSPLGFISNGNNRDRHWISCLSMPRTARVVVPNYVYHITQRGNGRQNIFRNK